MLVAPVGVVGLDVVGGQDLAGVAVDDGDGVGVDDHQDGLAGVADADAEVVHVSGAAQADLAVGVDMVEPDPEVAFDRGAGGDGFGSRGVGLRGGGPAEGPVWSAGVVGLGELVELGLETDKAGGGGLSGEPPFQSLVEAFDLALGLRVVGVAVLLLDAERC